MTPDRRALIFDCDGVLADTERYGHLPAFNAAFAELGIPARWSDDDYAELVRIGGGKERIAAALAGSDGVPAPTSEDIRRIHAVKTRVYRQLVADGVMPARPGVRRLITEAVERGWKVAVASTSAVESVRSVLEMAVGPLAASIPVFAGDVVPHKKPAPDIYLLALTELGVDPSSAAVVEDSGAGLSAARAAGLECLVTPSAYTLSEDFSAATAVVSTLGDPGEPLSVVADPHGVTFGEVVDLTAVNRLLDVVHASDCATGDNQ